jgi:hypothetical protein
MNEIEVRLELMKLRDIFAGIKGMEAIKMAEIRGRK